MVSLYTIWSLSGSTLAVIPFDETTHHIGIPQHLDPSSSTLLDTVDVERLGSIAALLIASNQSRSCKFQVQHADAFELDCACVQGSLFLVCHIRPRHQLNVKPNPISCSSRPLLLLLLLEGSTENNLKRPMQHLANPLNQIAMPHGQQLDTPENSTTHHNAAVEQNGGCAPSRRQLERINEKDLSVGGRDKAIRQWLCHFVPDSAEWWRRYQTFCSTLEETEESRRKRSNAMGSAEVLGDRQALMAVSQATQALPLQQSAAAVIGALEDMLQRAQPQNTVDHSSPAAAVLSTASIHTATNTFQWSDGSVNSPSVCLTMRRCLMTVEKSRAHPESPCLSSLWWSTDSKGGCCYALGSLASPTSTTLLVTTHEDLAARWRLLHAVCSGNAD